MHLLDRLERRFGRFAIKNLILFVAIGNAAVYLIDYMFRFGGGVTLSRLLELDPRLVFEGEVWRVLSFVFVPGSSSLLTLLQIYFIYFVGTFLQRSWSPFRLNVYYFIGIAAVVTVSLATGANAVGSMLNISLFLAFAAVAPEMRILLFFFIPVKVKWLGWVAWGFLAYQFLSAPTLGARLSVAALVANFFLFFWRGIAQQFSQNRRVHENRRRFEEGKVVQWQASANKTQVDRRQHDGRRPKGLPADDVAAGRQVGRHAGRHAGGAFHKCEVCGATEISHPQYEFRYCSRCAGDHEYCIEHLATHEHARE